MKELAQAEECEFVPGRLASVAARIVMKVFYGARLCRPDLLRAITFLACTMTK